jgi:ribosome-binding protein aMBF1 (putative translation factor)
MSTKKSINKNLTSFDDLLGSKYGLPGSPTRDAWEHEFDSFRLGVILEQARLERGLTQEQLAQLCGTKKSYISRIENNASDIRLKTLTNIVEKGLGGKLKITLEL